MTTADSIINELESMRDVAQCEILMRFFKTEEGSYGAGDMFLGIKVPQTRSLVTRYKLQVPLSDIETLLYSQWHEVRLAGFLLLVEEMKAASRKRPTTTGSGDAHRRKQIATFYLQHGRQANNWDLVDLSAPYIVGRWLAQTDADGKIPDRKILDKLADSDNLWLQRIAIVSTLWLIRQCYQCCYALRIIAKLLNHQHPLIHKAMGWVLREIGKKDITVMLDFVRTNYHVLPRTTLRYAIERLPEEQRKAWLKGILA